MFIFIVSDRCASGEAVDSSGPRLRELANTNFDVYRIEHIIIPDDLETIEVSFSALFFLNNKKSNEIFSVLENSFELCRGFEIEFNSHNWWNRF